jgi:hypothetical protein
MNPGHDRVSFFSWFKIVPLTDTISFHEDVYMVTSERNCLKLRYKSIVTEGPDFLRFTIAMT